MADIPTKTEIGVTTGPIRGSKKIHVAAKTGSGIKVAMREIYLDPSCDDAPVRVYDTSGPYTDDKVLDRHQQGPPRNPRPWIARAAMSRMTSAKSVPKIMASLAQTAAAASRHSPMSAKRAAR